jgi:hypothetical protein
METRLCNCGFMTFVIRYSTFVVVDCPYCGRYETIPMDEWIRDYEHVTPVTTSEEWVNFVESVVA